MHRHMEEYFKHTQPPYKGYTSELAEKVLLNELLNDRITTEAYVLRLSQVYGSFMHKPSEDYKNAVKSLVLDNNTLVHKHVRRAYLAEARESIKQDYLEGRMSNVRYRQWSTRNAQIEFDILLDVDIYDQRNRLPRVSPSERKDKARVQELTSKLEKLEKKVEDLGTINLECWGVHELGTGAHPMSVNEYRERLDLPRISPKEYTDRRGKVSSIFVDPYEEKERLQRQINRMEMYYLRSRGEPEVSKPTVVPVKEVEVEVEVEPISVMHTDLMSDKSALIILSSLICATIVTVAALML